MEAASSLATVISDGRAERRAYGSRSLLPKRLVSVETDAATGHNRGKMQVGTGASRTATAYLISVIRMLTSPYHFANSCGRAQSHLGFLRTLARAHAGCTTSMGHYGPRAADILPRPHDEDASRLRPEHSSTCPQLATFQLRRAPCTGDPRLHSAR
jgi:hypothetical protein